MISTRLDTYIKLTLQRRIGSTLFGVMGINYDRQAVVLFSTKAQAFSAVDEAAQYLEGQGVKFDHRLINRANATIGRVRFGTISELDAPYSLVGIPLIIDHFALLLLVEDDQRLKEQWTRDSERNRVYSAARHVDKNFNAKAVTDLRAKWDILAAENAEKKMREELGNNPKPDWKF